MTSSQQTIRKESEIGPIPQEWEILKLGALINKIIDNRGKNPPIVNQGYELIETGCMTGDRKYPDYSLVTKYVDEETYNNWFRKGHPQKGDILVATVGANAGDVCIMKENRGSIAQNFIGLQLNLQKVNSDFIYYLLVSDEIKNKIKGLDIGSVQPSIKVGHITNVEIPLPSLHEQQIIASVLGSLDDKIELLREQNRTLEKIGQTIFKEWFGKYSVEHELPKGWKMGKIRDIVQLLNGFPFKTESYNEEGKYKLVTIGNVNDGYFDSNCNNNVGELPEKLPEYCKLQSGDILLSLTGNVGRVCIVFGENYVLNQRVAKIVPNHGNHIGLCYFLMRGKRMQDLLISISRGTAQMNLSPIETQDLELVIPSKFEIEKAEIDLGELYKKILDNYKQVQSLSEIRDNMLPRLMSGKVRVNF